MNEDLQEIAAGRHPSVREITQFFTYDHLPAGMVRGTSQWFAMLAGDLLNSLPDSPELTAGLRKLLEAKDCFVRAAVAAGKASQ